MGGDLTDLNARSALIEELDRGGHPSPVRIFMVGNLYTYYAVNSPRHLKKLRMRFGTDPHYVWAHQGLPVFTWRFEKDTPQGQMIMSAQRHGLRGV